MIFLFLETSLARLEPELAYSGVWKSVQLKSFGSVFLVWGGRVYVCWMSWAFRGVRPSFGVARAHLHSAETLWKAPGGQISLRVEWGS